MNFRVLDEAQADLESTIKRLELETPGFGLDFRDLYRTAQISIRVNPQLYSRTEDGPDEIETREFYIERFCQRVIYAITDSEVVILAIIHAHRRPSLWTYRIDSM